MFKQVESDLEAYCLQEDIHSLADTHHAMTVLSTSLRASDTDKTKSFPSGVHYSVYERHQKGVKPTI